MPPVETRTGTAEQLVRAAFPGTVDVTPPRRRVEPYKRSTSSRRSAGSVVRNEGPHLRPPAPPPVPFPGGGVAFRGLAALPVTVHSTRRHWPVVTRKSWALHVGTGVGAARGLEFSTRPGPAVAELLAVWPAGCRRLYLCGPPPALAVAELRRWALAGELPEGWSVDPKRPHHLAGARSFVLHFLNPAGEAVSVLRAAAWFGEGDYTAREALAALAWLWRALRASWGEGAGVFDTPATTGRDLWARSIERPDGYGVLPDAVRQLVQAQAGQGRIEGWWDRGRAMPAQLADGIEAWDGAVMYAALCDNLGVAPVVLHDQGDDWPGPEHGGAYAPAWYRVRFTVPDAWASSAPEGIVGGPHEQLGLLPVKTGDGWSYPASGTHTAWCHGSELFLAWMAYGRGAIEIRERLVLSRDRGKGPLHTWAHRLLSLREQAGAIDDPRARQLARRAVRALIITAIGAFAQRERSRTVVAEDTVEGLTDWSVTDDGYVWLEPEPGPWAAMAHPEWAAAVWARCRARMLSHKGTGALHLDPADVVAVYVDALYVAGGRGAERWPDVEQPGRLRRKYRRPGPVPTPTSWAELWELER